MKDISVKGPKKLLKALADQWEENGWQSDAEWNKLAIIDYNFTHLILVHVFNASKFGFYDHSGVGEYDHYTLPDDWNELADLKPEPEFKEGDWVVVEQVGPESWVNSTKQRVFRITGGIESGFYATKGNGMYGLESCNLRKATPEEVEKHLIEEAKRRGFKGAAHINPIEGDSDSSEYYKKKFGHGYICGDSYDYYPDTDTLEVIGYGGHVIYCQGQWAEIIDQTPEIKINGHKVELPENNQWPPRVRIGCREVDESEIKHLYEYMSEYNLSIHRKGEDITEQIKEIAKQL